MNIPRAAIERALRRIDPAWTLEGAQALSRRATALDVSGAADARIRLVLLTHSAGDRRRNPDIARDEFRTLRCLRRAGLPVARPLHLEPKHMPPFLITKFVEGCARLSAQDSRAFCEKLADALSEIHNVDLARQDLSFLPKQEELLKQSLMSQDLEEDRIVRPLRRCLPKIRLKPSALLHGDFWPGNLLWSGDRLTGIIDWEDAMLGDPLSDLGKSRLEILWALGAEAMNGYTARYLAHNPALDASALPFWDLWGAHRLSHYAAFAGDPRRVPAMRAQYDGFVDAALAELQALIE